MIRAFEPLQEKQFSDPATKSYLDMHALCLQARMQCGAVAAFRGSCSASSPEDRLAAFHLKRLLNGAKGSRIAMD